VGSNEAQRVQAISQPMADGVWEYTSAMCWLLWKDEAGHDAHGTCTFAQPHCRPLETRYSLLTAELYITSITNVVSGV
jgi:hypothetical protein